MNIGRGTLGVIAGVLMVMLATIGHVLSPPAFDPPPLRASPQFRDIPAQPAAEVRPIAGAGFGGGPFRTEKLLVPARNETLRATIRAPLSPGRHPAFVFVQGSGSGDGGEFTQQAEWLARAGVVTLAYDKRTVGYSFRSRDFGLLADDALRMLRVLRQRPDVDPARAGLWGVSEGGWVVPIAAARDPRAAFVVLVSSPNVSPLRQVAWALNEQLLRLHAPTGVRDLLTRVMGGVGFDFLRYDGAPALRGITQPVLALYGTDDPSIPFVESTQALTRALRQSGDTGYTIRFLAGADHAMRVNGGAFAADYLPTLANWIRDLPRTARPSVPIAGATPVQRFEAADVPAAPWWGDSTILWLTLCLAAVGYVAAPVTEMVVRLRGRDLRFQANVQRWPAIRRRLRRMAWIGLGELAAVMAFITLIVLFSVNQAGAWPAVQAGWLVVRLLAVAMLAQTVATFAAVAGGLRDGWEPTPWQKSVLAGVLGGTALLLLTAAYYGLFAFPW
ncbi:alpha/beta hydrolase family protein [Microbispora triticiradicis]|uniref:Prolyl oligopeptidase family serine peptidase n=2 Tax=Microbispora TaxID=2005 RepID=A0ABY3LW74_9ACTN|nr:MULTISPECIES: prolyl oligopeptidase family serine peptidase [Microbispora]TLP63860.1 alpha/beta hydrolase [Microbispora fusca]TYB57530.1 prolyl oligopeptidase family serine peptidase [Microbispora tritici]